MFLNRSEHEENKHVSAEKRSSFLTSAVFWNQQEIWER